MHQSRSGLGVFGFLISVVILATGSEAAVIELPEIIYYNLTTTSRLDNYVIQNQRQYDAVIESYYKQLMELRKSYFGRLETIEYNTELLEQKLHETHAKLEPMQLINDVSDYCVHKYRPKLPGLDTIRNSLVSCKQKATAPYDSLVSPLVSTQTNLRNYYNNQFATALKTCKSKWAHMAANHTSCVIATIKTTNDVTTANINAFQNNLKQSTCTTTMKIKETFDCYSAVVFNTFSVIGEVMRFVENCTEGHEFCASCDSPDGMPSGRCPYHMSWHLSGSDLQSEKINNPFKGIDLSTPCLQMNFVTSAVTKN